ncbi:MAG: hypothetical protein HC785_01280 [Calothrix sp. CSU_2_0]|nr:hypothetical protein [Calothrix sp. CSU_2_0]
MRSRFARFLSGTSRYAPKTLGDMVMLLMRPNNKTIRRSTGTSLLKSKI